MTDVNNLLEQACGSSKAQKGTDVAPKLIALRLCRERALVSSEACSFSPFPGLGRGGRLFASSMTSRVHMFEVFKAVTAATRWLLHLLALR